MVLVELFRQLRVEFSLTLRVIHLNHQLRKEAEKDALFVRAYCDKNNIPLDIAERDVAEKAKNEKVSIEMAARQSRYEFFNNFLDKTGFNKVAIAHNANDRAETVLHHILRGTGIRGLQGIPVRRGPFIRPLLWASRDEIESFADKNHLNFCKDRTNVDISFTRNKIRHVLIPLLEKEFNPGIVSSLNRLCHNTAEFTDLLKKEGRACLQQCMVHQDREKIILDIQEYLAYLKSLQKIMLHFALEYLHQDTQLLTFKRLENIEQFIEKGQSGVHLKITDKLSLLLSGNHLIIGNVTRPFHHVSIKSLTGSHKLWNNYELQISNENNNSLEDKGKTRFTEWIDADALQRPVAVRSFKKADSFFPINGTGRKKISDFFIDRKVEYFQRTDIPILECKNGIVWICGYRLDDRFKVKPETKKVLRLELVGAEQI